MTDITERYNQEIESTIQYDISELLHTDLSDDLKERLMNLGNPTVDKFIALFPIQDKIKFSTIRDALNGMKVILPKNLFEETKEEVKERVIVLRLIFLLNISILAEVFLTLLVLSLEAM